MQGPAKKRRTRAAGAIRTRQFELDPVSRQTGEDWRASYRAILSKRGQSAAPSILNLQRKLGNRFVQRLVGSQSKRQQRENLDARLPKTGSQGRIYRHISYEHRLLGDTKPSEIDEMVAGRVDEATRRHVLEREMDRLLIWRRNPKGVTEAQVESTWPGVRMLRLKASNLLLTYGELNTLPDYMPNPDAIDTAPENVILPILQMVRQQGYNRIVDLLGKFTVVSTGDFAIAVPDYERFEGAAGPLGTGTLADIKEVKGLNKLTAGRGGGADQYQALVSRNACHFAPFSWERWQEFHDKARELAEKAHSETDATQKAELERQAWLNNGYADHFLQDSFAAGHLINKTLIMQWFVEWLAEQDISITHFERIAEMTESAQPLLAGRGLYHGKYDTTDPQTAEEHGGSPAERASAAGLKPSRGDPLDEVYQDYLAFLNSSVVQSAAGDLHNYFNDESRGMWVTSPANPGGFKVYGDATLLRGGEGVRIAAATAQMSQQAIADLIDKGEAPSSGEVRKNFPDGVRLTIRDPKTKAPKVWSGPLEQWHDEVLKQLCWETVFPDVHYRILDLWFAREMGRVSKDAMSERSKEVLKRSSNGLIEARSGFWGLDEAGLARDLKSRSSIEILSVLDELDWGDRDDVSYEYARQSTMDELMALDNSVINRMIREMEGGWTSGDEEEQIARLRRAKAAKASRGSPEPLPAVGGPPPTSVPV